MSHIAHIELVLIETCVPDDQIDPVAPSKPAKRGASFVAVRGQETLKTASPPARYAGA
jgi:hypothetical protein